MIASLSIIKSFWKIKIKSHGNEVTDFYNKEIPKVDSNHTCLKMKSVVRKSLKECKYINKNVVRHVIDDLESSSDDSDDSDEE